MPAVLLGTICIGGAYGSYSLTRGFLKAFVPSTTSEHHKVVRFIEPVAYGSAIGGGALLLWLRELYCPKMPPAPKLSTDSGPIGQRMSNTATLWAHTIKHYPYRYRFVSFFAAGCAAGVTSVFTEFAYVKRNTPVLITSFPDGRANGVVSSSTSQAASSSSPSADEEQI